MDYPRWLRIIIWPETAEDMSEPMVPEASEAEFRHAFIRMREMGYAEDRFPSWFIEKIRDEDRQLARQSTKAPEEALTSTQSEWVIHFGPEQLTSTHWRWGSAADYAVSSARSLAARSQLSLKWGHPLRKEIENARLRQYPASSSVIPSLNTLATASQSEAGRTRVMTWLAANEIRSSRSSDNQDGTSKN